MTRQFLCVYVHASGDHTCAWMTYHSSQNYKGVVFLANAFSGGHLIGSQKEMTTHSVFLVVIVVLL